LPARRGLPILAVGADLIALLLAFSLAYRLHFSDQLAVLSPVMRDPVRYLVAMAVLVPLWLAVYALRGLYARELLQHSTLLVSRVADTTTFAALLTLAGSYLIGSTQLSRGWLVIAWLAALVFTLGERELLAFALQRYRRHHPWRVLIAGAGQSGVRAAALLAKRRDVKVVGFLDDYLPLGLAVAPGARVLDRPAAALRVAVAEAVDELLVVDGALARESHDMLLRAAYASPRQLPLLLLPSNSEELLVRLQPAHRGKVAVLLPELRRIAGLEGFAKALTDRAVAALVLLISSPLFAWTWARARLRGQPFLQGTPMVGEGGRRFQRWSFAGWGPVGGDVGQTLDLGRLRGPYRWRYVVEKLPRVLNVLRGQLSLVGPRPIVAGDLPLVSTWAGLLLSMKPGVVGPWLLHGQSSLTPTEEVQADVDYVREHTLLRDVAILCGAVRQVSGLLFQRVADDADTLLALPLNGPPSASEGADPDGLAITRRHATEGQR